MPSKPAIAPGCPVARTLEQIGEGWSLLILRDAFQGFTRFDEFEKSLGIAPNILSRRLTQLTDAGLFERRLYCARPPRYEYVLTHKGRDLFSVVMAIFAWGNRHLMPGAESILVADRASERRLDPIVVDARSLQPLTLANVMLVPGPAATAGTRARLATLRARRSDVSPSKG